MGAPIRIDFGTQSHPGRAGYDVGPRHINAMIEQVVEGQPSFPIYAASGLASFATVANGGKCRGGIVVGNKLVTVTGQRLVSLDAAGTVTDISGIPGASWVSMARNAKANSPQVAIVSDGNVWSLEGGVLSDITDPDLEPPNSVTFLDQRVIFSIPSGRIRYSDIDDVTSIDSLSFAEAEGAPDGLKRAFSHKLDLWLPGDDSTEIWRSTSNTSNPFQRVAGGFIPKGCASAQSMAALGDTVYWVGNDNIPYRAPGYQLQALDHPPVCEDIKATIDRNDIAGWTYYERDAGFYVLSGPTWSWQFNSKTGKWFERQSYNSDRWMVETGFQLGNKIIGGGSSGGLYYEISPTAFDEAGANHVMTVRSPPMHAFPNRLSVDRLYVDCLMGVGLNSTVEHESAPKIGMRYSDDGGQNWSRQKLRSLGVEGHHNGRVVFNGLGTTGRGGRIWELQVSSPVVRGIKYAAIEGDPVGT